MEDNKIALFKGSKIRRTIHNNEWWFVVEDVVLALIDSSDPQEYIQRIKQRDPELSKGWGQFVHTLEILTEGGKQKMNRANTEGIFRIIQSIPSPKAEPFKRWLAKVGYERATTEIHRTENSHGVLELERRKPEYEANWKNNPGFLIPDNLKAQFEDAWNVSVSLK